MPILEPIARDVIPTSIAQAIEETRAIIHRELLTGDRDLSHFERIFARDAKSLPLGGPTLYGREQILAFWETATDSFDFCSGQLHPASFELLGDRVLEIGTNSAMDRKGNVVELKYVLLWHEEDGFWKVCLDVWNYPA